jgi:hypothetical protein
MRKADTDDLVNADLVAAVDEAQAVLRDALGRLAIAFGNCEVAVAEVTASALGAFDADSRDGIDAVLSFRQKLDLIAAVGVKRLASSADAPLLEEVLRTLGQFEDQRNSLLHSKYHVKLNHAMYFKPEGFERSKQRAHRKRGLLRIWSDVDPTAINALAREIMAFSDNFEPRGPVYRLYDAFAKIHARGAN